MNSKQIVVKDTVPLPTYAYFNKQDSKDTNKKTWKSKFDASIKKSCGDDPLALSKTKVMNKPSTTDSEYIDYSGDTIDDTYQSNVIKNLAKNDADIPTAMAAAGLLTNDKITNSTTETLKDQIRYLACQVAQMHAREYDSKNFPRNMGFESVTNIFSNYLNLRPYLIVIFFVSIYLLVQGFFGSVDVGFNIATNLFSGNVGNDVGYWAGIFIGVAIPFIIIMAMMGTELCKTMDKMDHINITENPYGDDKKILKTERTFDYSMLIIFIFFICLLMCVLYVSATNLDKKFNTFVLFIVLGVLLLLTVCLYVFYTYTPFLSSAQQGEESFTKKRVPLELYVDRVNDIDKIQSNQTINSGMKKVFLGAVIVIYVLAMVFFKINQNRVGSDKWYGSILRGMTGSSAILIIPIIWVFNSILSIKLFYLYPILIMISRGVRYFGRVIFYKILSSNTDIAEKIKEGLGDEFLEEMTSENMKTYTPSWGLIGMGLLKTWMNMCGFENKLSKQIVENSNGQKDLSQDTYVSSLMILRLLAKDERSGNDMKYAGMILLFTIVFGSIYLFGVEKVQYLRQ